MPSFQAFKIITAAAILAACTSEIGGEPGDGQKPASGQKPGNGAATPSPAEGGDLQLNACVAQPACDGASKPDVGPQRDWIHMTSRIVKNAGDPHHRGRDQIVPQGDPQWIIGKMTYGATDKDLKDEEVDIFVERGCGGAWEKLGTAKTTNEGAHATVEGVEDSGGRVYFEIPKDKALGLGRHRVRLVVMGDLSSTDLLIDVVPPKTPVFVSDVDGTLTESENAEFPALLSGELPKAQPNAPEVLRALAELGYRPIYLTARPEWLTSRTREFLTTHKFPPGIIHTTTTTTGATGDAAAAYKSGELEMLVAKKLPIVWAFGNKESDTNAYEAVKIEPKNQRVFLQVNDAHGGRRIEGYADVLSAVKSSARACQ